MEINMKACLCAESAGQASGKNLQNAQSPGHCGDEQDTGCPCSYHRLGTKAWTLTP